MKHLNKLTRVLVDFQPGLGPEPIFFLYEGQRLKVDEIMERTPMRKTFDRCILYKCMAGKKMVELRWDKDKDRWFIEKMGE